jgi:hypothetical protein
MRITRALSVGVISLLVGVPAATHATAGARHVRTADQAATTVRPTVLPPGFKRIDTVHRDRDGGRGTIESTTYGVHTKREIMRLHGHDLGPTVTLSIFRGPAPVIPAAQDGLTGAATRTVVRGHDGWAVTTSRGDQVVGWTEAAGLHVQVIAGGGLSRAALDAFVSGLVAS